MHWQAPGDAAARAAVSERAADAGGTTSSTYLRAGLEASHHLISQDMAATGLVPPVRLPLTPAPGSYHPTNHPTNHHTNQQQQANRSSSLAGSPERGSRGSGPPAAASTWAGGGMSPTAAEGAALAAQQRGSGAGAAASGGLRVTLGSAASAGSAAAGMPPDLTATPSRSASLSASIEALLLARSSSRTSELDAAAAGERASAPSVALGAGGGGASMASRASTSSALGGDISLSMGSMAVYSTWTAASLGCSSSGSSRRSSFSNLAGAASGHSLLQLQQHPQAPLVSFAPPNEDKLGHAQKRPSFLQQQHTEPLPGGARQLQMQASGGGGGGSGALAWARSIPNGSSSRGSPLGGASRTSLAAADATGCCHTPDAAGAAAADRLAFRRLSLRLPSCRATGGTGPAVEVLGGSACSSPTAQQQQPASPRFLVQIASPTGSAVSAGVSLQVTSSDSVWGSALLPPSRVLAARLTCFALHGDRAGAGRQGLLQQQPVGGAVGRACADCADRSKHAPLPQLFRSPIAPSCVPSCIVVHRVVAA